VKRRFILAPEAARDLVQIWRYLKEESGDNTADRVEAVIRSKLITLRSFPTQGTGGAI
jgi:plasmid stabilization system protein ParE